MSIDGVTTVKSSIKFFVVVCDAVWGMERLGGLMVAVLALEEAEVECDTFMDGVSERDADIDADAFVELLLEPVDVAVRVGGTTFVWVALRLSLRVLVEVTVGVLEAVAFNVPVLELDVVRSKVSELDRDSDFGVSRAQQYMPTGCPPHQLFMADTHVPTATS